HVVIELEPGAFWPVERREDQLVLAHWPAEKDRHISQTGRRSFSHYFRNLLFQRTVNHYAQRAIVWIMGRKEKHRPAKVWIEHIRMGNQQRPGQALCFVAVRMTHTKTRKRGARLRKLSREESRRTTTLVSVLVWNDTPV